MEVGESSNSSSASKPIVNDLTHLIVRSPPAPKGRGRGRGTARHARANTGRRSNKTKTKETGKNSAGNADEVPVRVDAEKQAPEYEPKPREERPYTDFFPDLDLTESLKLVIKSKKKETLVDSQASSDDYVSPKLSELGLDNSEPILLSREFKFVSEQVLTNSDAPNAFPQPSNDFDQTYNLESLSITTENMETDDTLDNDTPTDFLDGSTIDVRTDVLEVVRTKVNIATPVSMTSNTPPKVEQVTKIVLEHEKTTITMEQGQILKDTLIQSFQSSSKTPEKKLPVPSFRRIDLTLVDEDYEGFVRPEGHYIRHLEPTEMELAERVEYDMDEQDQVWLSMLNTERKKEDFGEVSEDIFEAVMDRLEKEWFDLTKNIPKANTEKDNLQPEDSACAICDDAECENSNAIVFCDGCNLAVHQDCYGIPYIPEGQWLCRKCMISPENPVSCLFCPNEGGAFKQTNTNHWAHLLCGIWIPEVSVSNLVYMEPIDNIERIPRSRWKLVCFICRRKVGACIQCENKHCFTAFHPTCARKAKLCMKMKSFNAHYDVPLKAYCDKHTPREYREHVDVAATLNAAQIAFSAQAPPAKKRKLNENINSDEEDEYIPDEKEGSDDSTYDDDDGNEDGKGRKRKRRPGSPDTIFLRKSKRPSENDAKITDKTTETRNNKAARAYNHLYSATAPIAPAYILQRVIPVLNKHKGSPLRKKLDLVASICKYWSLKRESRRGAPLLKRLHLEPWTASASAHKQTEAEKAIKFEIMRTLRKDMEKVRLLADLVQRREKEKLRRIKYQREILENVIFPLTRILRPVLEEVQSLDKQDIFAKPVSLEEAPDYHQHIKHPMDFSTMRKKIDNYAYDSIQEFKDDLELTFRNAMTYNTTNTIYYRTARRLQLQCQPIIAKAEADYRELGIDPGTNVLNIDMHPEVFTYNLFPLVLPQQPTDIKDETIYIPETGGAQRTEQVKEPDETNVRRTRSNSIKEKKLGIEFEVNTIIQDKRNKRKQPVDIITEGTKEDRRLPKGWVYISEDDEDSAHEPNDNKIPHPPSGTKTVSSRTRSHNESSELGSPVAESSAAPPNRKSPRRGSKSVSEPNFDDVVEEEREAISDENTSIPIGSLVWAKMQGFPWYPAEVEDPDDSDITPEIMADRKEGDVYLVHFFDEKQGKKGNHGRTWKWVPESKILLLGDEQADLTKLRDRGMTNTMKKEIPLAYEAACASRGLSSNILQQLSLKTAKPNKGKVRR